MNTTSLAVIQGDELDTIQRTAKLLAASGYFGTSQDGIIGMAQVAAKILAGRELGFGPFASVNGIHIINGKPTVGANLMAAAVRSHSRYDYKVKELTDKVCELEFYDNGKAAGVSRFTVEDAAAAELSTGKNSGTWKKFARNMLFARAMSNGVRWFAPDIFSGNAVYVPEELGAEVDGEGNVVDTTYTVTAQESPQRTQTPSVADSTANGTNVLPGTPVQATEGKPRITKEQHDPAAATLVDHLNAMGEELYAEKWPQVREHNTLRVSKERTPHFDELKAAEVQTLIDGMNKVKAKRPAKVNVATAEPVAH